MIRFFKAFYYFIKDEEKYISSKVKLNGDDRGELELLNSNGILRKPLDQEKAIVIEDRKEKKYYVLKTEGSTIPTLEPTEVAVYFNKDNFLKITKNKKIKVMVNNKSLFDVLNGLIDQIKSNQTLTQLGLQPVSPASQQQMELVKNELAEVME